VPASFPPPKSPGPPIRAVTRDISASGVDLSHHIELAVGQRLLANVFSPTSKWICIGLRVGWCRPCPTGAYISGTVLESSS
jgi:hypothetical protein